MRSSSRNSSSCREGRIGNFRLVAGGLAALAVFFLAVSVHAVDPDRRITQYLREHWGSERGLAGGVNAIAQTPDGYLWVGTEKGLFRFDGITFRAYPQAIPTSLAIGPVQGLVADSQGNLWILLKNTTILRYRDQKFEVGREEAEAGITSVTRCKDGSVLFSSLALGVLTYQGGKFKVLTAPSEAALPPANTSIETNDEQSSRLSWATGVTPHRYAEPNSAVLSMAQTPDGKVWLGTQDKGLFYLSHGQVFHADKGAPTTEIHSLLAFQNGDLWIATDSGVLRWNGAEITSDRVPPVLRYAKELSMIRDRDSNIWLGSVNGVTRVSPDGTTVEEDTSEMGAGVPALFEDREGNIWVGSSQGLDMFRDGAFVSYSVAGLQSQSGGPIYVDPNGREWFAPIEGGLHWLDGEKSGSVTKDQLGQDVVYSIAGSKDELWVGRQRGGLTHLIFSGDSVATKTFTQADGLPQNSVYAVYKSRDGSVWAATLNAGLSEYSDDRFTTYTTATGLASNTVAAIEEGADGTMWFGTPNGLNSYSKGKWQVFTVRDGMPADNVNCLLTDTSGTVWIGTSLGIAYLKSGHIRAPSDEPAPLREQILGIAEDRNGLLWIATSNHVLSVKRDYLLGDETTDPGEREYGLEDGLRGTEGVRRQKSVFADNFGRVWFSLNRGLSEVDTPRIPGSSVPATIQIEGLTSDGNSISLQGPVRIPPGSHRVTFDYSGLSLSVPERVKFKYKLDGFDKGWSQPVSSREAVYTNLSAGTYRFHVIASNSDGIWSDHGATLDLSIAPAWYETSWFRIVSIVLIVSIAIAFYRIRVRQIGKAISARFDERLAERTRMARELHDTFLQTIQGSKLVADDALDESTDSTRMRHAMEQLSDWLGLAIQEGRAALNSLRTSTIERNDLAEALERATQNGLVPTSMAVSFSVEGEAREMHPIVRDEVYRIGYEAIRNAYAHSRGSKLEVELRYAQDLAVRVSDNGIGIDPGVADRGKAGHFGLQGMRERAARIGGKISIASSAASGTEIIVVVPGRIVFRKAGASPLERIKSLVGRGGTTSNHN